MMVLFIILLIETLKNIIRTKKGQYKPAKVEICRIGYVTSSKNVFFLYLVPQTKSDRPTLLALTVRVQHYGSL